MQEAVKAKQYWGTTEAQQREYREFPPFYATALCRIVRFLEARRVFEFGCNAGRNLQLMKEAIDPAPYVAGIDINEDSINFGLEKWGLEIEVGDEHYLAEEPANSCDVLFTVSVLDHIPDIAESLQNIFRFTEKFFITVEPHPEEHLHYLHPFKSEESIRSSVTTETPFSYTHALETLIPSVGFTQRLSIPLPTYKANFGPLYRLDVWEKSVASSQDSAIDWERLKEVLWVEVILEGIELKQRIRKTTEERTKFSQQAYRLQKRLDKLDGKN